jgi:hypothetical protein
MHRGEKIARSVDREAAPLHPTVNRRVAFSQPGGGGSGGFSFRR